MPETVLIVLSLAALSVLGLGVLRMRERATAGRAAELERRVAARTAELDEAFARLRKSEEYFRALFENALELITVLDAQGRITYENPSNEKFVGYTREEMLGKVAFQFFHPDDLPAVQAAFAEALKKPGAAPVLRLRMRHKDGAWRWLEAYGNNLLDNPSVRGLVINSRDVTEEVAAEARIKELNALRDRFVNVVAHQLRTPLNAVRWNLESALEGGSLADEARDAVRVSHLAAIEVIRRIDDMLTALDIQEGKFSLSKKRGSIEAVWQDASREWLERCRAKRISCGHLPSPAPIPEFAFDPAKIRDVFIKLADNALDYTPEGGRITTSLVAKGGMARFEMTDSGIGIPRADQPRIFERFFRASNAHTLKTDADGVGLSIVRHFIEAHGGKVGFVSEEGRGSTFWFEIPT